MAISGLMPARTVHLHLTRRCNLACLHCYSSSSPQATEAVKPGPVLGALEVLRSEGYEVLALSGGEPLLHPDLPAIARAARDLGFGVTLITNGVLMTERGLDTLADCIHGTAVSFDGAEAHHNHVRRRKDAFQRAVRALGLLRARGIGFALSCSVSHGRLEDVVELYHLADTQGARALQISPIVAVGRGAEEGEAFALDEDEKARLSLMARLLDATEDGPRVRAEVQSQADFQRAQAQFALLDPQAWDLRLSDLVNPLVITETGRVQPFAYGLDPSHDLGRLDTDLRPQIAAWRGVARDRLAWLVARSFTDPSVTAQGFVEWYADLVALSRAPVPA